MLVDLGTQDLGVQDQGAQAPAVRDLLHRLKAVPVGLRAGRHHRVVPPAARRRNALPDTIALGLPSSRWCRLWLSTQLGIWAGTPSSTFNSKASPVPSQASPLEQMMGRSARKICPVGSLRADPLQALLLGELLQVEQLPEEPVVKQDQVQRIPRSNPRHNNPNQRSQSHNLNPNQSPRNPNLNLNQSQNLLKSLSLNQNQNQSLSNRSPNLNQNQNLKSQSQSPSQRNQNQSPNRNQSQSNRNQSQNQPKSQRPRNQNQLNNQNPSQSPKSPSLNQSLSRSLSLKSLQEAAEWESLSQLSQPSSQSSLPEQRSSVTWTEERPHPSLRPRKKPTIMTLDLRASLREASKDLGTLREAASKEVANREGTSKDLARGLKEAASRALALALDLGPV